MEWINYHHYLYFWLVVREGGILPAAKTLRLAHSTVSAQLKQFEAQLGATLFRRDKRRLELTEAGRLAFKYAEEIFPVGQEFVETLRNKSSSRPQVVRIGATDAMPKLIVRKLIMPVLQLEKQVRIRCDEGELQQLLALLATHQLDVLLSDTPLPAGSSFRAFNHQLGECAVTFFASKKLAKQLGEGFPNNLNHKPFLMPTEASALRLALERWFYSKGIQPQIVAEFADSALMKVMGQDGLGVFCTPSAIEADVQVQYQVVKIGQTNSIKERFYAISAERHIKNDGVIAICESARAELFK